MPKSVQNQSEKVPGCKGLYFGTREGIGVEERNDPHVISRRSLPFLQLPRCKNRAERTSNSHSFWSVSFEAPESSLVQKASPGKLFNIKPRWYCKGLKWIQDRGRSTLAVFRKRQKCLARSRGKFQGVFFAKNTRIKSHPSWSNSETLNESKFA